MFQNLACTALTQKSVRLMFQTNTRGVINMPKNQRVLSQNVRGNVGGSEACSARAEYDFSGLTLFVSAIHA